MRPSLRVHITPKENQDLKALLAQGCDWIQPYLASDLPLTPAERNLCPQP